MNIEKMLYHANEKGSLNFDVRSMKGETKTNLQFLLDGGYLEHNPDSIFAGGPKEIWQDYRITPDGEILLAIYRLEYAHKNERDTEKHQGRMDRLNVLLEKYNRNITYFDPSMTNKQRAAVNYMNNISTSTAKGYVQKLKEAEKSEIQTLPLSPFEIVPRDEWHEMNELKDKLDNISLDEVSLVSMFNMSVGLGQKGTDASRHEDYVMKKCAEELGELSLEINISQGLSYKEPGKDGIKGEAVDLAICALDMFALQCHNMTPEEIEREFLTYMLTKLNKWKNTLK